MATAESVIAIDGPAASGKSTVGRRVADRLGFLYLDTGAMYRAITLLALEAGLDPSDNAAVGRLAEETPILIEPPATGCTDDRQYTVRVGERDITWAIRRSGVERHISSIAALPRVREALKGQQRRIGRAGRVVMVGRDIGTVVMPEAPLKLYLDASTDVRAARRHAELRARGVDADLEPLRDAMRERDRLDSSRTLAPLRPADDAIVIDSGQLGVGEVVERVLALAAQRLGSAPPGSTP